eukprot:5631147-Pyramimonas_sp.AAC.2
MHKRPSLTLAGGVCQEDSLSDQVKRIEEFKSKNVDLNEEDDSEAEDDMDDIDLDVKELQGKQTTPTGWVALYASTPEALRFRVSPTCVTVSKALYPCWLKAHEMRVHHIPFELNSRITVTKPLLFGTSVTRHKP